MDRLDCSPWDGEILPLPYQINIAIGQVEIDRHFRVLCQEGIEDGNEETPAKISAR